MRSDRRTFIMDFGAAVVGATALTSSRLSLASGPGEQVGIAVIGCGSQGEGLVKRFGATPNVRMKSVCDVDESRREKVRAQVPAATAVDDFRRVLDDKDVDAVVIATPDHWHTPAAVLAMKAGKHVYVEKPCCQNFHEGTILVETVRRTKKIVQHGTQFRSDPLALSVIAALREGVIGDVLMSKAWNVQRRKSIGHERPTEVPAGVDYDLWVGPAEFIPFQANRFHYNWRWWRNFGSGDMGNDGAHELDLARWGLGVDALPDTISGVGGKYYFDDDQEFPDTMTVAFEYAGTEAKQPPRTLLYEQRLWSTNYPFNVDSGVEFYGTKGKIFVSKRGKLEVLGERNAKMELPNKPTENAPSHYADFVEAIRNSRTPHADVDNAFRSAALSHLGNLTVRLGRSLKLDPVRQQLVNDPEAGALLARNYRPSHWAIPEA
ncbi:Gfo/Idh/MocA family protein [Schlesneria paludicola]|uniref:Gfo/Idh/MocA family protein n=1 Tax=Schlesneria paludicola TaxID=360056 RepID=UPI0004927BA1|nr:Gfo/Idh/MocA family oxidoreductase [Schlesneria paludicola]